MILILLLSFTIVPSQTIYKLNDSTVAVPKLEFKKIINNRIELATYKSLYAMEKDITSTLDRELLDKDALIKALINDKDILRKQIDIVSPAWYDNFLMGFGGATLLILTILLLVK
jgi:hypothetical protein